VGIRQSLPPAAAAGLLLSLPRAGYMLLMMSLVEGLIRRNCLSDARKNKGDFS
jgi:hypothetical protein